MLFGIPRSARWLVTKNRIPEARDVLEQLGSPDGQSELDDIIASVHVDGVAHSEPLFQRKYRLPIYLAFTVAAFNQLSGINAILYYSNYIFAMAGFSKLSGDLQSVAIGAMNLVATLLAMTVIDKLGRRTLLLIGGVGMTCLPERRRGSVLHPAASGTAGVVAGRLHCVLRHLSGRRHLGVHQRGLPQPRTLQGTEPRQLDALDHERCHLRWCFR